MINANGMTFRSKMDLGMAGLGIASSDALQIPKVSCKLHISTLAMPSYEVTNSPD